MNRKPNKDKIHQFTINIEICQVSQLFIIKHFSLEYQSSGSGKEILLCFHGFGQDLHAWDVFLPNLIEKYTVYAFSFFHHGKSEYPKNRIDSNTLRPEELKEIFDAFLKEKNIENFSLMGYSMGAKISFQLMHFYGERIDSITLLAADGIYKNFWYNFTSKNRLGNLLYHRIIKDPSNLFAVMKMFRHFNWINDKLYRFAKGNLDSRKKRQQVYDVWMTLRHIDPSAKKSAQIILENNIKCKMIFGKYDKVITVSTGEYFNRLLNGKGELILADCGHNLLIAKNAELIK
jgi:pimeloyl-ACP methyl ester carboxylesterase